MKKEHREIFTFARDELGAQDCRVENGSKHQTLVGRFGPRKFKYTLSGDYGDSHAWRNVKRDLRRLKEAAT